VFAEPLPIYFQLILSAVVDFITARNRQGSRVSANILVMVSGRGFIYIVCASLDKVLPVFKISSYEMAGFNILNLHNFHI